MKLEQTFRRPTFGPAVFGVGWVLFGPRPDNGRWTEKWFPSRGAAAEYAAKRGWGIRAA